jgi:opacity protein-like surface antigen
MGRNTSTVSRLPLAVLACGLALTGGAAAADMRMPAPAAVDPAPQVISEFGSGWYLRGDVGYAWRKSPGSELTDPVRLSNTSFGNNVSFGAGVGFKQGWFRTDITADYFRSTEIRSRQNGITDCDFFAGFPDLTCDYNGNGYISAFAVLWNVYADLGTWHGITPYIGAGVGTSYVRAHGFSASIYDTTGTVPAADNPGRAEYGNRGQFNFAWALMAGASYSFSANHAIDIGYRYTNLGRAQTAGGPIAFNGEVRTGTIDSHEVRVGFRYTID